jgi:hypothetical protein
MKIGIPKLLITKERRRIIPNPIVTTDYVTLGFAPTRFIKSPLRARINAHARGVFQKFSPQVKKTEEFWENRHRRD